MSVWKKVRVFIVTPPSQLLVWAAFFFSYPYDRLQCSGIGKDPSISSLVSTDPCIFVSCLFCPFYESWQFEWHELRMVCDTNHSKGRNNLKCCSHVVVGQQAYNYTRNTNSLLFWRRKLSGNVCVHVKPRIPSPPSFTFHSIFDANYRKYA